MSEVEPSCIAFTVRTVQLLGIWRTSAQDCSDDPPCCMRKIPHFLVVQWPSKDIAFSVGQPLLESLVAAEPVVPDGGGDVAPERRSVEENVEGRVAESGSASPTAARSSAVQVRST